MLPRNVDTAFTHHRLSENGKEQVLQRLEMRSGFWLLLSEGTGRSCLDQVVALQANSAANPSWDVLPAQRWFQSPV